jgi:hypothetical protein
MQRRDRHAGIGRRPGGPIGAVVLIHSTTRWSKKKMWALLPNGNIHGLGADALSRTADTAWTTAASRTRSACSIEPSQILVPAG